MSIEIKKTGKNTYYRKDGNKMGSRKERQEILNISIKYWETDMAIRHRASSKLLSGWGQFDGMLSGGLKKGEMAMVGAVCGAFPEDHFKSNVALAAVRGMDRNNVVMIGMEHEFDHTDRLAEEIKNQFEYIPYNRPIPLAYIDGVPYNPMDEFDRPEYYKEKQFVTDMQGSYYLKNPEEVLSEQFQVSVNDTHQKLVTDAINSMVNVNKPYRLEIDNEGRQLYPETTTLAGVFTFKELNVKTENFEPIDIFKDEISLDFFLHQYENVEFNINSLVKNIDDVLAKDNKEVLVIDKEDDKTYFSKTDDRYKSVIVDSERLEINPESAITTDAYKTIQESLLKLLESIKGDNEYLLTYKSNGRVIEAILIKKEWYMQKSKITLNLPDWMIEPKDVYTFMSSTGISEEEKIDTLTKRLDKLLKDTEYSWVIEEKMVPDKERAMIYTVKLTRGNFVVCAGELDNNSFYTKIEALASAYKVLYNLIKNDILKIEKEEVTFLTEDVFKSSKEIGRGFTKPYVFMDLSMEELLEMIFVLLPEDSEYVLNDNSTREDSSFNVSYYTDKSKETTIIIPGAETRAEALSNFHTYLRNNKDKK